MTKKLFVSAITKYILGVVIIGALIFLPAGTLGFFNGWLFMAVLFVPMFFAGVVMMIKNPQLLRKRLDAKEKQKEQDLVVKLSGLMFILSFVTAGLSYRFNLLTLPLWGSIVGTVFFLLSYVMYAFVLRENEYLSRTIGVCENQRVVDTGLYSIVRHPMYSATLVLFVSMPFVLGSMLAVIPMLFYPVLITNRIKHEEKLLEKELFGYSQYKEKVKYRLIPFVW